MEKIDINPTSSYFICKTETNECFTKSGEELINLWRVNYEPSFVAIWGAIAFGFIIGWFLYYTNRYRAKGSQDIGDIAALIGVLGGGIILNVFSPLGNLFSYFSVGLFMGFIFYFILLNFMVYRSKKYDWPDFFLNVKEGHTPFYVKKPPS